METNQYYLQFLDFFIYYDFKAWIEVFGFSLEFSATTVGLPIETLTKKMSPLFLYEIELKQAMLVAFFGIPLKYGSVNEEFEEHYYRTEIMFLTPKKSETVKEDCLPIT